VTAASPIELLHPAGQVRRMLVLGDRCPPSLLPSTAMRASGDVDLALIAPSPADLRQRRWLERAAATAACALAEHGFAYALLPRRRRPAARVLLRRSGLVVGSSFAQLPVTGPPRHLLPLRTAPVRHALTRLIGARRGHSFPSMARLLPVGSALLAVVLPTVGIVARRPGADPLASWVTRLGGGTRETAHVAVTTSWRGPRGPIVLYCFAPAGADPWGIAKVAPETSTEADLLDRLGDAARAAGARVPRLLAIGSVARNSVLVQTVMGGHVAADLLMRSPGRFPEIVGAMSSWQERWNRATVAIAPVTTGPLRREVVGPADELAGLIPDGAAYRDWLAARCASLPDRTLPLVAKHNDLTMWNVVLDGHGSIGVIDWAEAEESGLPLTDFFYAVVDAAAACDGYRSRLHALRDCFLPGGARQEAVARWQERLRASLQLTPAALELSFHACWLRHARNEHRAGARARPFLHILGWLARRAAA
jgi:Phosphotransferase enzyme family